MILALYSMISEWYSALHKLDSRKYIVTGSIYLLIDILDLFIHKKYMEAYINNSIKKPSCSHSVLDDGMVHYSSL